ncbi:MAG: DUF3575 domain-containing protein, partial [Muribaculaceae bacterium]|nr:DUF3575 domain-containing protein [Muribaculaceae bacterium]
IITGTIALLCAVVVFGQNQADTIKVYFEVNRDKFNPALFDNASVMERFIEKVDSANSVGAIERIDVFGYSSPEGSHQRNQRLSDRRCRNIADYIVARTGVDPQLVTAKGMGEAWDELRAMIEANPDVPYRARLLDIIDNTPEWIFDKQGHIISGRKKKLMDLAGGRPYRWLIANIFPELRYALTVSVCYAPVDVPEAEEEITSADTVIVDEPIAVEESIDVEESVAVVEPMFVADSTAMAESLPAVPVNTYEPLYRLAIKTNLLYDAALLPNLEVEWLFSDHWSVALEGDLAWWGNKPKEKSYRLAIVSPEVKYWIRPRAPWHGFFVGLLAGGGLYDLEGGGHGYYGEGAMGGLSVGYMWPLNRRLALEAEIGGGYLYTRCKEYVPFEGHHVYQRTRDINYFGPLKVKFSLVWRFWDAKRPVRKNNLTAVQYEE